ncbi:glyoxylate reductase [Pullulanibacillus pueri]|uniref:D-glycerate dehydrogenase n=1 Tax=Pullulanibacillus pueri TaxID=1437324 RepID=A0A8J2ZWE4_9BACL|nr:D-glycerate dehydrogenase [Pullulanibacillus pueri]MBM7682594.1 glyoxylate reductase [Pullulanibacillus pueri]GGH82437.1 D-glycerate dehydrogenase [Pullulanibacillus pueri]
MKPKIFVTRKLPEETMKLLKEHCDVKIWEQEDLPVPREVLIEEIQEIDGLYCLLTEAIDKEVIDRAKKLKVISNMAVGYNNIDIESATKQGIAVTNTPGVLTETTADLTFSLLMSVARRIVDADCFLRNGNWKTWSPMLLTGQDIHGATLGIIGLGRIGEALAKRAQGFNMKILYHNRTRKYAVEERLNIHYVELEALLRESDFVCILTPYTEETKNLIDEEELSLMKESAILINSSRGGIVNEEALYKALLDQKIWGAGLDVFEEEPVSLESPLLSLPNVVVTPHIGSASIQTRHLMAQLAAENLIGVLNGKSSNHIVNEADLKFNSNK